jgi:phospholipid/cholesterol/gamma-HCH transport system substrate-binding protein
MLTRLIRIQLAIFIPVSIIGIAVVAVFYMQVPTLLGLGHITVTLELPDTGGLYRFSNVTYRGVQIGRVTEVHLSPAGVKATLSLDTSPKIPSDLQARVRSVSAVGEQYVDLWPRRSSGPYLDDGSVIPLRDTSIPQAVGPMLDQVSSLIESIPKDKLSNLLDEVFKGVNGAGYDMGSLLDSASTVARDARGVADRTSHLTDDAVPLLDSQAQTADSIRTWARSLAGITQQVVTDDSDLRTVLKAGPGALDETSRLLEQVKPTLPVLLANLTTIGQLAVTYNPSLEQLLVLLPPEIAAIGSSGMAKTNPTGLAQGEFTIAQADPVGCTVGYLPPSSWRSPADTTDADTPDGLYCKLPQDSPIGVRGARNYPCMEHPGKRAPTVEICNSDKPYEPLAMRPHALGPSPLDPNLLAQGIPPDDRITFRDNEFGPVEGTPRPPGVPAPGAINAPPRPGPDSPPPPPGVPDSPPAENQPPQAAPSAFGGRGVTPRMGVATYNPTTGAYVGPDRRLYWQSNLAAASKPKSWKDMLTQ